MKSKLIVPGAAANTAARYSVAHLWRNQVARMMVKKELNPAVLLYCPEGAIVYKNGTFEIDGRYCKGCGICARESDAITMCPDPTYREE